jgi:hypothetical protein
MTVQEEAEFKMYRFPFCESINRGVVRGSEHGSDMFHRNTGNHKVVRGVTTQNITIYTRMVRERAGVAKDILFEKYMKVRIGFNWLRTAFSAWHLCGDTDLFRRNLLIGSVCFRTPVNT